MGKYTPVLKQWRDGRWYFNYSTGSASPLWKSRKYAEGKLQESLERNSNGPTT